MSALENDGQDPVVCSWITWAHTLFLSNILANTEGESKFGTQ